MKTIEMSYVGVLFANGGFRCKQSTKSIKGQQTETVHVVVSRLGTVIDDGLVMFNCNWTRLAVKHWFNFRDVSMRLARLRYSHGECTRYRG